MLTKIKALRVATLAGVPQQRGHKDGLLASANFADPTGICVSDEGVVYVTDSGNHRIRRFTLDVDGFVETVAGCGRSGRKDGPALKAHLSKPSGICFDLNGGIIFVEEAGGTMRTLINAEVKTVIGAAGVGYADGPVAQAQLRSPRGVCQAPDGSIYIADNGSHRIRRVDTSGMVHSIGSGRAASTDGTFLSGSMLYPSSVCATSSGTIYVGELYRVRRLDMEENTITTYDATSDSSLTAAIVPSPYSSSEGNRMFYTDSNGCRIMCLTEKGKVKLIAGTGRGGGFLDGTASESKFTSPHGIAFTPDGSLLICDSNHCIRIIRDMYPPTERSLPSAGSFSLEPLLDLLPSKSTSEQSPMIPFHPNLALLAYPTLATLTEADIRRATLPKQFQLALPPTSAGDFVPPPSHAFDEALLSRTRAFYHVIGTDPKVPISTLLSTLLTSEALRMPQELILFLLKRFVFAMNRAALTPARLIELLIAIATTHSTSRNAAYLIVERIKHSGTTAAQTLPQLEESIRQDYLDYYSFISELFSDKISSPTRVAVKSALSALKPSSSSGAVSAIGGATSSTISQSKNKRRSAVISPYLISRCTSLFWTKVACSINKTLAPTLVALEEHLEPLSSSDVLNCSHPLLSPNYTLMVEDQKIMCHDWILYARWPWFRSLLQSGMEEAQSGTATIPTGSFSYAGFVALLYYLYSHKTELFAPPLCVELLRNAEEFRLVELLSRPYLPDPNFEPLIRHCQQGLMLDLTSTNCPEKLRLARELKLAPAANAITSWIARNITSVSSSKAAWDEILQLDAEIIKEIFALIPWENLHMKPM